MNRIKLWLEESHRYVSQDYDNLVPVVGEAGFGKSTLLLQMGYLWHDIVHGEPSVEATMDMIAWDFNEFKQALAHSPSKQCIMIHDAARVLQRKKSMHGDQIEIEEDLFDARFGNYLIFFGYQDFDSVPKMLMNRARNLLFIPTRGRVRGYTQQGIKKRYKSGKWPEPVLSDSYPDLKGTKLWDEFVSEDQRRKKERIEPDENPTDSMSLKEIANQIIEDGVENVTSINPSNGEAYIDKDLIEVEYELSIRNASKVTKLVRREIEEVKAVA